MVLSVTRRWLAGAALGLAAASLAAQSLPSSRPEDVGLSSERLGRIGDWVKAEVAAKRIPGAVVMVARNGKVAYYEAIGQQGPASPRPMDRDSIFRIYSMTKPLVSVATMMMVEEGKLLLEASVSRYISGFANARVGVEKVDPVTGGQVAGACGPAPANDGAGPAASHVRTHLRLFRRFAGEEGLSRCGYRHCR